MARPAILRWIVAAGLVAAAAAAFTTLPRARDGARDDEGPVTTPAPGPAPRPVEAAPSPLQAVLAEATVPAAPVVAPAVPVVKNAAPSPPRTGRSPLEQSPGYYPPADPESASVRLGRREAPEVPDLFHGGAGSMEELGRAVVSALNARDEKALHALRVTRSEFERILWREFPESRPITNITAEDAWSMSEPRSLSGANRSMGLHGGRQLRFLTIEAVRVQAFTNFLLHRDVVITAVDEGTAEIHKLTLAPSVAERRGRFKALLYRD